MAGKKQQREGSHKISFAYLGQMRAQQSREPDVCVVQSENDHWQFQLASEDDGHCLCKGFMIIAQGFDREILHMRIV